MSGRGHRMSGRGHRMTVSEIALLLSLRAHDVCIAVFGANAGRIKWGRFFIGSLHGEPGNSLSVYFDGSKPGNWKDFATGERGDILDLVRLALFNGDKPKAVLWAKRFLGIDNNNPVALETMRRRAAVETAKIDRKAKEREDYFRRLAGRIWLREAKPDIRATPVEHYLNGRGIDLVKLKSWGAIRYHDTLSDRETGEVFHGMVTAIAGGENSRWPGKITAVHRTFLEPDGRGGWRKAEPRSKDWKAKRVLGPPKGGYISIAKGLSDKPLKQAPDGDKCLLTEGIEDALTWAMALPDWRVVAAPNGVSTLAGLWLPDTVTTRVLIGDNDAPDSKARATFMKAVAAHARQCADTRYAFPPAGVADANALLQRACA